MIKSRQFFVGLMFFGCLGLATAQTARPLKISDIRAQYPNARISIVSHEQYLRMLQQARTASLNPVVLAAVPDSLLKNPGQSASVAESENQAANWASAGDTLCDSLAFGDSLRCSSNDSLCDSLLSGDSLHCKSEDSLADTASSTLLLLKKKAEEPAEMTAEKEARLNTLGIYLSDIYSSGKKKKSKGDSEGESEWAVVILVVVGAVVVAGFLFLGGKILYDIVVNKEKFPIWRDFSLIYTYTSRSVGQGDYPESVENTSLLSGRFALGWQRPVSAIGVGAELGYMDVSITGGDGLEDLFFTNGYYMLLGPTLRFGKLNPMALKLSFYNGTANRSSVGLISQARVDFQFRVSGPIYLGAHFGAFYADIDYSDGYLIKDWGLNSDFSLLYGAHIGYAF